MTKLGYANRWRTLRDKGYRLIDFERYNTSKGYRYAGIWRQNGNRINWKHRVAVDNKVKEYKDKNKTPGISLAVAKGGKIVYRRGFGYSDVKRKRVAHSETVYYTASVGKSIGATLAMRMTDKLGLDKKGTLVLDIKKPTSDFIPTMPSHHTHTVAQLLSHRACVRNKPFNPEPNKQYNSALSAAPTFWDKTLLTPCTIGDGSTSKYSNSAFTLLGAVLEAKGKKSISQLLQFYLAKPLGLGSLRAEYPLTYNYDRSERYVGKKKIKKWVRKNSSWKVLAGGMEIHAVDLARFGIKLKKGQVMKKETRDDMWTKPTKPWKNYGLGWFIWTNYVSHNGAFEGARSYIRIYKKKDLVIAILSNHKNNDGMGIISLADKIVKIVK
jgi:CubicO group peptidase (beta-lactamase class C family)